MARSPSSFGFMGVFGRSHDLKQLDAALRAADLHPKLVSEAVKLTVVNLLKDHAVGAEPAPQAYAAAAEMLAYCMLGPTMLSATSPPDLIQRVEARIERALGAGEGLDAQLILLTLHAKVVQPEVVDRFGLSSE
ncbi:MAG: hypothetical protein EA385_13240 [Salinarimonadaceae bacterium]|nr:MAG: hypothetical protein EA385_13240 [Salinarimonadaceae bacterium]